MKAFEQKVMHESVKRNLSNQAKADAGFMNE